MTPQSRFCAVAVLGLALAGAASGAGVSLRTARPTADASNTTKIAFARFPHQGRPSLATITPAGTHVLRLLAQPDSDLTEPWWSHDGRRIAYAATTSSNSCGIFVANAVGRNSVRVTRVRCDPSDLVLDAHPRWSPDGRRIVFHRWRRNSSTLYVVQANGKGLRSLGDGYTPSWSPDGRRIAFAAKPPGSAKFDIYAVNLDGTHRARLTTNLDGDTNPNWSPDGKRIAFEGTSQGNIDIYVIRANGRERQRLTTATDADTSPSWSPDGKKIVFASRRLGGEFDLYVMKGDGTDQKQLTQLPGDEAEPSWRPESVSTG